MKDAFISKIGVYGQMHYRYLKENKPPVVNVMRMKGTLKSYLEAVNNVYNQINPTYYGGLITVHNPY